MPEENFHDNNKFASKNSAHHHFRLCFDNYCDGHDHPRPTTSCEKIAGQEETQLLAEGNKDDDNTSSSSSSSSSPPKKQHYHFKGRKETMTFSQMRLHLRQELRQTGAIDTIMAQLRSQIILNLASTYGLMDDRGRLLTRKKKKKGEEEEGDDATARLCFWLIMDALKAYGFVHTLAIFLPESHMSSTEEQMTQQEILKEAFLPQNSIQLLNTQKEEGGEGEEEGGRSGVEGPCLLQKLLRHVSELTVKCREQEQEIHSQKERHQTTEEEVRLHKIQLQQLQVDKTFLEQEMEKMHQRSQKDFTELHNLQREVMELKSEGDSWKAEEARYRQELKAWKEKEHGWDVAQESWQRERSVWRMEKERLRRRNEEEKIEQEYLEKEVQDLRHLLNQARRALQILQDGGGGGGGTTLINSSVLSPSFLKGRRKRNRKTRQEGNLLAAPLMSSPYLGPAHKIMTSGSYHYTATEEEEEEEEDEDDDFTREEEEDEDEDVDTISTNLSDSIPTSQSYSLNHHRSNNNNNNNNLPPAPLKPLRGKVEEEEALKAESSSSVLPPSLVEVEVAGTTKTS